MATHFIGFRSTCELDRASRIFGPPDFIHRWHDKRAYGDIDTDHDTIVFGSKANPNHIVKFSDQDHERH